MSLGPLLCRVAVSTAICVGSSGLLPLTIPAAIATSDEVQELLTKLSGLIFGVSAGNTASAIDNFFNACQLGGSADFVPLENEDLIRVSGKAIAQIIALAAKKYNHSTSQHLEKIAAKATENWVELARIEFAQSRYEDLTEKKIPLIITPTEEGLTKAQILTVEEWRTIFAKLDLMAVDSSKGVDLSSDVRQFVAELLHQEFPRVLREALKQDFKADGKAFAGLMIQLITEIRQQVNQQGQTAIVSLAKLNEIEKQLIETEQIEKFFANISTQMQTGFDQLCSRFGIAEININENLQKLQNILVQRLDDQSEKLDYLIDLIQPHPRENVENKLLRALLHLDYDKQANLFKEFVENHQIGACLIHGSFETAPRWLLNRLIRNVPNGNTSNFVKTINFSRRNHASSLYSLFQEVGRKFGMVSGSVTEVQEKICQVWQSETVILIIKNTQDCEESYIEEFLQEFWQPLANLAHCIGNPEQNHSLLLFLLDEDGDTNDWDIAYTQDPTSDLIPYTLIKLMEIQPLKRKQLSTWLELHCCAENLLGYTDSLVEEVFRDSQEGVHQYIFEKICSLCQTTWEECESKWLKY